MDKESQKVKVIEQLRTTPIVQVACKHAGVARATFYRWLNSDEDFKSKVDEAQLEGVQLINELAESKLIASINEQNLGAIKFWLTNRHTAYKNKIEVSAKPVDAPLTDEEKQTIEKALMLSPLNLTNPTHNEDKQSSDTAMPIRQKNQDSSSEK